MAGVAILQVSRMGHPVLRAKAREVERREIKGAALQQLIDDMIITMVEYRGAGLAAPQVHHSVRLFVAISGDGERDVDDPLVLINPRIEPLGTEVAQDWEGCLSIPNVHGLVPRPTRVAVRGLDRQGQAVDFEARDFFARVIQHEADHLDGVLFLDRMTSLVSLEMSTERARGALTF